jgi:hypothetical protein
MRRYELMLISATGKALASTSAGFVPSTTGLATFSSTVQQNGQIVNNPGALNLEADIPIVGFALPQGGSFIRVSGVGLKTIGQSSNLNRNPATGAPPATFILSAGMLKGYPLANPAQFGIIASGQVSNAYGNWQGPEQSLDLTLRAQAVNPPDGISFTWQPGQNLSAALSQALSFAFPTEQAPVISILDGFIQSQSTQNVVGWYESLEQFADYIKQLTVPLGKALSGNPSYPGVIVGIRSNAPFATDATQSPKSIQLAFQDFIGQPTWIGPVTISFKCVLRADIRLFDMVQMPPDPGTGGSSIISSLALTQQGAAVPGAPARNSSVFKGSFLVNEIHHFMNSRSPDADSWATAFTAVSVGSAGF